MLAIIFMALGLAVVKSDDSNQKPPPPVSVDIKTLDGALEHLYQLRGMLNEWADHTAIDDQEVAIVSAEALKNLADDLHEFEVHTREILNPHEPTENSVPVNPTDIEDVARRLHDGSARVHDLLDKAPRELDMNKVEVLRLQKGDIREISGKLGELEHDIGEWAQPPKASDQEFLQI